MVQCTKTVSVTAVYWASVPLLGLRMVPNAVSGPRQCQTCGTSLFLIYEAYNIAAVSIASIYAARKFVSRFY
jgi:hypothetical protein